MLFRSAFSVLLSRSYLLRHSFSHPQLYNCLCSAVPLPSFHFLFSQEISPHTCFHKFHGHIHPLCGLLRCHSALQEAPADNFHIFSDFDNMPVRIIKAHYSLAPGMFLHRMHIFNVTLFQSVCKFVKIIFFKIYLKIIAAILPAE